MGVAIFILAMAVLFIVIGSFLYRGKGSWLIAGYNMASPEDRAKYDEKKLCRAASVTCFVVSGLLCVMAYLGYRVETGSLDENAMLPFALVFIAVVLASIIWEIIYINKRCKK